MEFRFSEEDRQFRSELTTFLGDQLPDGWWGEEAYDDSVWPFTIEMRKKLGEKGWLAISWPKEYGGQDASPGQSMIYSEEMAYNRAPGKDIQGVGLYWAVPYDPWHGGAEAPTPETHIRR